MLKHFLILLVSVFVIPSAMAVNCTSGSSYIVMDDDDDDDDDDDFDDDDRDDKDNHPVGIRRPEIICRNISRNSADVVIKVRVRNKTDRDMTAIVQVEVEDQNDKKVAVVNDKVFIPAGQVVVSKNLVTIRNPRLHSADKSYRYEAEAEVLDHRGEEISESKERKFFISKNYGNARRHNKQVLNGRTPKTKLQKQVR